VPLVKEASGWRFDTAAGKEEVLARRIGRNELTVIETSRAYVTAQRRYAQQGHDGKPAGVYATKFAQRRPASRTACIGRRPEVRSSVRWGSGGTGGRRRACSRRGPWEPSPFHGYYFKSPDHAGRGRVRRRQELRRQGQHVWGFALIAWPAQYDATGVMTFLVNQDGVVLEKDLGPDTDAAARKITSYNPDASWHPSQ
jgi:hypothetical protein